MHFELIKESKKHKGRVGVLHTAHGDIETPVFMPVGTQATVKGLTPEMLHSIGAQIILGNTYHLSLRPGGDLLEKCGGLHSFMNWNKPILTDSGGYQVFSLDGMRTINDDGVTFRSHLDGSSHLFTPERVIDLQRQFGSDIMMPLDICSPYPCDKDQLAKDMSVTYKWEKRAADYWRADPRGQLLFGIVQGGMDEALRRESVDQMCSLDLPGYAIGGVSVGEPFDQMSAITSYTAPLLPVNKPRYLMGVGLPENMRVSIESGIDMFDCVAPTRLARHGQVFGYLGERISIKKSQYEADFSPIMEGCACYTCQNYSRAYLRHLFISKELLANTLMSIHNLAYIIDTVRQIRNEILAE